MELQDKLDLKKALKKDGLNLSVRELNTVVVHFDTSAKKIHRKHYYDKIGTRGIYSFIFVILTIIALALKQYYFMLLIAVFAVYNTIHFLSNYVFYKNKFSDRPINPERRVEQS